MIPEKAFLTYEKCIEKMHIPPRLPYLLGSSFVKGLFLIQVRECTIVHARITINARFTINFYSKPCILTRVKSVQSLVTERAKCSKNFAIFSTKTTF